MKQTKKLSENKLFKGIMTAVKALAVLIVIVFVLIVYLQRFSDNKISFFNYRMFTVISESMKPKYDIGDVLIAKEMKPSEIKIGDTVSYLGTKGELRDKVVSHEVVSIDKNENGKYEFHTKGLANIIEDPVVSEDQLFGVVTYKSVILTTVNKIIQTNIGFYLCIIIPVMIIIISEILGILLDKEAKRRQKAH